MTDPLRFAAPIYPGGRMCLLCGSVTVGAVFPPGRGAWRWSCWVTLDGHFSEGVAGTEADAKAAVLVEFNRFLRAAALYMAPLTPADALAVPEVAALVDALQKIKIGTTPEADPDTGDLVDGWMDVDEVQEIARAAIAPFTAAHGDTK